MNNDLISRKDLINAKPEFMNEKVIRDTKYRTAKDRVYAKAWNACNRYWLNTIGNAPIVEEISVIEFKEPLPLVKAQKIVKALSRKSQGEWISVKDRLPEEKINPYTNDFDEVLCTTDWGEVQAFKFGTPILHHKPHFWLGGAIMDEHVIAWQYKPEPYKESEAENE